jgi:hypothetical protein
MLVLRNIGQPKRLEASVYGVKHFHAGAGKAGLLRLPHLARSAIGPRN